MYTLTLIAILKTLVVLETVTAGLTCLSAGLIRAGLERYRLFAAGVLEEYELTDAEGAVLDAMTPADAEHERLRERRLTRYTYLLGLMAVAGIVLCYIFS